MDTDYESVANLGIYLNFHFGNPDAGFAGKFGMARFGLFHEVVLDRFLRKGDRPGSSALDIGCGVGGASFHLSKFFDRVKGIDLSGSFVSSANVIKEKGRLDYRIRKTGNEWENAVALLPNGTNSERIIFKVGDACDSSCFPDTHDCVIALNLLCRTPDPRTALENIAKSVRPGGQVILSMPLSWSQEFTPREHWINGDPLIFLQERLGDTFKPDGSDDIPFLMCETERKHYWCVSHCSSWTKKTS